MATMAAVATAPHEMELTHMDAPAGEGISLNSLQIADAPLHILAAAAEHMKGGTPASATRCLLEQSLKKQMPEMAMPSFSAYDRALMLKLIMSTGSCDHGLDECVAAFREVLPQEPAELISASDDACGSQ